MTTTYTESKTGFIMAPEDVEPNVLYTFTISPCDDKQFFNILNRREKQLEYYQTYIQAFSAVIKMTQEVSRNGRLHYHGTITWPARDCIARFYIEDIHTILQKNQIEIGLIKKLSEWYEYCSKGKAIMDLMTIQTTDSNIKRLTEKLKIAKDYGIPCIVQHKHTF